MTHLDKMTHAELQNNIVKAAKLCGFRCQYWWKSIHSPAGFPDLFMIKGQKIILAELKVGNDKLSPSQIEWKDILTQVKTIEYYEWHEEDWISGSILEILKR